MLRFFFAGLLLIHGVIHIAGFTRAWKLAGMKNIPNDTLISLNPSAAKILGVLWLFAALSFLFTAFIFLRRNEWWLVALTGLTVSQLLIIIYWPGAKWGAVLNVAILIGAVTAFASSHLEKNIRATAKALLMPLHIDKKEVVTEEAVHGLPAPVQRWLYHCGMIGNEKTVCVRLKQKGWMRTKPEQENWTEATAVQYITVSQPAFIWHVKLDMLPAIPVVGYDRFINGKGQTTIKLLALFGMVNETGEKIDQGALQRYLAEMCWTPAVALLPCISWQAIDANTAQATMTYKNTTGTVVFHFDAAGDIVSCTADRYKGSHSATPEKWEVHTTAFGVRNGIRMPIKSEATWKLKNGDFTWYKLEITELEYNTPQLYND